MNRLPVEAPEAKLKAGAQARAADYERQSSRVNLRS